MVCIVVSGISVMYKTPVNERTKRSAINKSVDETPGGVLVEPSVLNTPEGPGKVFDNTVSEWGLRNNLSISQTGTFYTTT